MAGLLSLPLEAAAEPARTRLRRVAVISQGRGVQPSFVQAMVELGHLEGRNVVIEDRAARGEYQRFPTLIAEVIAMEPEVLVVETTPGALAAKRATSTIPIVIVNVSDPVGSGLVASLGRPGGNITGVTDQGMAVAEKSVDLVRAIVPSAARLGVLMSDNPVHPSMFQRVQAAADRISLSALSIPVTSMDDLDRAFSTMIASKADAFIELGGSPISGTFQQMDKVVALAAKTRLPAIYSFGDFVRRGGLMSYGQSLSAKWTLAATCVDRILRGAKPADLPIRQPITGELFINRKTAASLGLTLPPALLLQANKIFS